MRWLVNLFVLLVVSFNLNANDSPYAVNLIPSELLENANMVVRNDSRTFTVSSAGKAVMHKTYAITILNEKAKAFSVFYHPYSNKREKVSEIKGTLYDADGNEVKKLKKSDIRDYSDYDGFSVYSDARIKLATSLNSNDYPYTVEYQYSEEINGLLFYPTWRPQYAANMAIEKASFRVGLPASMELRYKEVNLPNKVETSDQKGLKYYQWKVSNLNPFEPDDIGPNWFELIPQVYTGPNKFVFGGYSGEMNSWENFGKWIQKLNNDLDQLPPSTVEKVKQLVADAPNQGESVRRIYQYLQESTRYVSIQLGIGGYQPFDPSFVDKNGYGDCKALSYYAKSMLDAIGINSHYTLVNAGANGAEVVKDFPSSQFNHVILCVPQPQDTLWLECTSQTNPFGYLGSFTGDRDVLLITDDGGKMVRTPKYSKEDNKKVTVANVYLNDNGDAKASINTTYSGLFYEEAGGLVSQGLDDQKEWMYKHLDIPSFQVTNVSYKQNKSIIPDIDEHLELELRKHASVSGKRIFLKPTVLKTSGTRFLRAYSSIPPQQEQRRTEIIQKYDLVSYDTIIYHVPSHLHPEYMPPPVSIESDFGRYDAAVTSSPDGITYTRKLETNKGVYPAESYQQYRSFIQAIIKADKTKIVLKNAT